MAMTVSLRNGIEVPALGMGSWNMGDDASRRSEELDSLRAGLDAGLTVIDTAEMYGNGRSEHVVGEAIRGRRDDVFLVSKVLPSRASKRDMRKSCIASLERLGTGHLDLYLLHWRGGVPLDETVETFERLCEEGLIRAWGVSNFDVEDMEDLEMTGQAAHCVANQVLYSLDHRGVEFDLLAADAQRKVATMAYSPIGQGGMLLRNETLADIARKHQTSLGAATPAQIALAWVLRQPNVIAIPKASTLRNQHLNLAAREITLTAEDYAALDKVFAPPRRKMPLEMI